jgi:integrase
VSPSYTFFHFGGSELSEQIGFSFLMDDTSGAIDEPAGRVPTSKALQRLVPATPVENRAGGDTGSRAHARTLQTVLDEVNSDDMLSSRRRRDLASAIKSTARLLDRPLDQIPADFSELRRLLNQIHPAALGMSDKRFANVRAGLKQALTGDRKPSRRANSETPLTAEWAMLYRRLTEYQRIKLSRFLRYCSARSIAPTVVDLETLDSFATDLGSTELRVEPDKLRRQTALAWNRCVEEVEDWPSARLDVEPILQRWVARVDKFPAGFKADLDAFGARLAGTDLFAEDGPPRPLRHVSRQNYRYHLLIAATAAMRTGMDASQVQSLADLVEIDRFKAIIRFLHGHYGRDSSMPYLVATTLKMAARYHVKAEHEHVQMLGALCSRVVVPRHGLTKKNRDRLRPFHDKAAVDRLLTLPQSLMRRARSRRERPRLAAIDAQLAVAIEILLMAPIRMANLAAIRIGVHLDLGHKGGEAVLTFPPQDTKNGEALEFPLPRETAELIREYIQRFLPKLSSPCSNALFPGRDGEPKASATLGKQIGSIIWKQTGLKVNPHFFRHLGASLHLDRRPGEYEAVRRVLGHKSINTTTNYYTGLDTAAAARRFDEGVLNRRRQAEARGTKKVGRGRQ